MDEEQSSGTDALATGQLKILSQYRRAGGQPVVEPRQSALQRIQVGLIGLVVVLLFVSLANMVLDRVVDAPTVSELPGQNGLIAGTEAVPDEPLAELGVTPVAKEDEAPNSDGLAPAANNNVRQAPAPQGR
jgi:hypothetical protein